MLCPLLMTGQDVEQFRKHEEELAALSDKIVNDSIENERAKACFDFIPKLVEALKLKNSFDYPFDSLKTISIQYPKDRSFRIFTWQLHRDNGAYRFYGAIQMNSKELELFPLFDYSDSLFNPVNEVLTPDTWLGCLYYNIYEVKVKRKKYYTLFGWDGNDLWSTKKVMDILHFEDGKPVFGAPIIEFTDEGEDDAEGDDKETYTQNRFIIEYRADVAAMLNYVEQEKMIIYDHLISPDEKTEDLSFTYVPDGTYEGFKFEDGKWQHVDKVFHYAINEFDNPPVPFPKEEEGEEEK